MTNAIYFKPSITYWLDLVETRQIGLSASLLYSLAPGVQLVSEYAYTQRHQGRFDFNQSAVGATRDGKGQGVMVATVLTW